jgi:hypothetical protein
MTDITHFFAKVTLGETAKEKKLDFVEFCGFLSACRGI